MSNNKMNFNSIKEWINAGMPFNSFVLGDCMEAMQAMPDNFADLSICDPPYGIGNFIPQGGKSMRSDAKEHMITWNDNIPDKAYFAELKKKSKEQIIWGANYYNCFNKNGGAIVWFKGEGNPLFSGCEIASYSKNKRVDYIHINWQSGFYRASIEKIIHECQKPVALYRWLLKKYAQPGWKILDTHVGSASSLIACEQEGFDYVGFEIDPDYYKAATERIKRERMQLTLALESEN